MMPKLDDGPHLALVAGNYCERAPAEALRSVVRCVWRNVLPSTERPLLVVPDGCIDLLWTGSALLVAGPDTGPVIEAVSPDATIVGLRLHPGAATPWLNVSAAEIANRRLPLAELWGRPAEQLAEQLFETSAPDSASALLEQALSARMRDGEQSDRTGQNLLHALEARLWTDETNVRHLAADLAISERTIRRRCNELFGYGPKTFARILRFQQFIGSVRRRNGLSLSALASLCGYADQAHLSREVRRLSGLTPKAIVEQLGAPCDQRVQDLSPIGQTAIMPFLGTHIPGIEGDVGDLRDRRVAERTDRAFTRTLVIVRHGITDWNVAERLQGHIDVPLNEDGIGQARSLRESLASFQFDAYYSSPLSRAKQTAEIVAGAATIRYDWRLAEINHGIWQGMTKAEINSRWAHGWALWQRNPSLYTPDGGESFFDLAQRVRSFLKELQGSTILCVTHGQVIQTLFLVLLKRPVEEFHGFSQKNADVQVFNLK